MASGSALTLSGVGAAYFGIRQMGSMDEYKASVLATREVLSERPRIMDLIRYATLAPNGHNTQPWQFRIGVNRIDILPDFSRRTPVV
ncbi:MAG: Tat pathway signal protein, partial [Afipia sp.]|nr:Tat pathway signal protein [Afipia sp.]